MIHPVVTGNALLAVVAGKDQTFTFVYSLPTLSAPSIPFFKVDVVRNIDTPE